MGLVREILRMIVDNTLKTGYPVPVRREDIYSWAEGLRVPRSGGLYLYTGALYQLVPYINSLVSWLESFEKRRGTGSIALRLARTVSRTLDLSKIIRPRREDLERSKAILRSIYFLLEKSGVEVAYLYEKDGYSGILLHDMGFDEAFAQHARKVYKSLRDAGVEKVLTIDPHTTFALRRLYPEYVEGFDIEVYNYLEVVAEKLPPLRAERGNSLVIHDPCYYARYEEILDQPRLILKLAGYKVVEPKRSRKMTYCCGGPVEALSPSLSKKIAEARVRELLGVSKNIVTLCPICLANLSRVAPREAVVRDIAEYVAEALSIGG